jgi:alpha-galactosidase
VVLVRPLQDGSTAVGLFNRADQPQEVSVKWSDAGLTGTNLHARDLWKHAEAPLSGASYTATVPAHGVVLLKVAAK